mgnify:CR=1 FL=1
MKLINGSVFLPDGKFSNADVVCSEKILDVTERAGCDIRTDIQQEKVQIQTVDQFWMFLENM